MSGKTVFDLLRACQKGEAGSIVGRDLGNPPQLDDLYVRTQEDEELQKLFATSYQEDGTLVILTGSAGDGKSALLAKAYQEAEEADISIDRSAFHLDATGSGYLQQSYKSDLDEFLDRAIAEMGTDSQRKALAINYGLAIDYFKQSGRRERDGYGPIWEALDEAESKRRVSDSTGKIVVINLGHRDLFSILPDKFPRGVLTKLIDRFDISSEEGPLHSRSDPQPEDCPAGRNCPLHYNLSLLRDAAVRQRIARLIAANAIMREQYINPRSMLDQISRIILDPALRQLDSGDTCAVGAAVVEESISPKPDHIIPNRVMEVLAGEYMGRFLDPVAQATAEVDNRVLNWGVDQSALRSTVGETPVNEDSWERTPRIRTAIRQEYLLDGVGETHVDKDHFELFLGGLAYFQGNKTWDDEGELVIDTTIDALRNWTGQNTNTDQMDFVDGLRSTEYRFTARWERPSIDGNRSIKETKAQTRPGQLQLYIKNGRGADPVFVPLGYPLFHLMNRVKQGYNPSSSDLDHSHGVRLLYSQLSQFTKKRELVTVKDKTGEEVFSVSESSLGSIRVRNGGS